MSTVVFAQGELAADTQTTGEGRAFGFGRKIGRIPADESQPGVYLYGAVGDVSLCQAFMRWVSGNFAGQPPKMRGDREGEEATGIVYARRTTKPEEDSYALYEAWVYEAQGAYKLEVPEHDGIVAMHAIGSGAKYAIGAAAMGATAAEACKVAMAFDIYTGGEITSFRMVAR